MRSLKSTRGTKKFKHKTKNMSESSILSLNQINKKKSKREYTRKDIIEILKKIRSEVEEVRPNYVHADKDIYRKGIDDSIAAFTKYINMDNDKPESFVKKYTKSSVISQLDTIKMLILDNKYVYNGESKGAYDYGCDNAVAIIDKKINEYKQ